MVPCTIMIRWGRLRILRLVFALSVLFLVAYQLLRFPLGGRLDQAVATDLLGQQQRQGFSDPLSSLDQSVDNVTSPQFSSDSAASSANVAFVMLLRNEASRMEDPLLDESQASTTARISLEEPIRNLHDFKYILNEPAKCAVAPELVVVVCTDVTNWDERQAVRETWGNVTLYFSFRVVVVFLVGSNPSSEIQHKLVQESQIHHDIIQEDFVDSYMNLTSKSVAMLRWVDTFCQNTKYALKSDDDMYIHIPNLLASLREIKLPKFIMGHVFTGARPKRDKASKWYVSPEQFGEAVYPNYTSGTAYAMTANAAPALFQTSLRLPFFWWEDVFVTGMCACQADVPRDHNDKFSYLKRDPRGCPRGCVFRNVISGHKNSVAEIRQIHSELMLPSLECLCIVACRDIVGPEILTL